MKKLLRNKRMFLTLIAGIFVFVAVLGAGTFAWFTGKDTITIDGSITTATVGVKAESMKVAALDFYPGAMFSVQLQKELEKCIDLTTTPPTVKQDDYKFVLTNMEIMQEYNLVKVFEKDGVPDDFFFGLGFIRNALTKWGEKDLVNVTPSSFIAGRYSFNVADTSTIPVYFRVQKARLNSTFADVQFAQVIRATIKGTVTDKALTRDPDFTVEEWKDITENGIIFNGELKDGGDGWYYCSLPLSPYYAWEVDVTYVTYLFGAANGNGLQNATLWFANTTDNGNIAVEVIQATNNAVYLHDDWKAAAGEIGQPHPPFVKFFVDYIDSNYGMYKTYLDFVF